MNHNHDTIEHHEIDYLECEKTWVFALLMGVGGFLGAFTYVLRGGVFCNAQTGNILLLGMALGEGNFSRALYLLLPISAYFLGTVISEAIAIPIKKFHLIRWSTLFVLIEMAAILVMGFIPDSAPFQITQVLVNFICSMQYNTFRQAKGIPMATTFCTNHLRQVGIAFTKAILHRAPGAGRRLLRHLLMLGAFLVGAAVSTLLCHPLGGKAVWFALIPLAVLFIDLLRADLAQHGDLSQVPRGH